MSIFSLLQQCFILTLVQTILCQAQLEQGPLYPRLSPHRAHREQHHQRKSDLLPRQNILITETVQVATSVCPTGTIEILPELVGPLTPNTKGIYVTTLDRIGVATEAPVISKAIPSPTTTVTPTGPATQVPQPRVAAVNMAAADIFSDPIATKAPPANIKMMNEHPVARLGVAGTAPVQTNKFYANFFLGDQTNPAHTVPYSLSWSKGQGAVKSWGLAISHVEASQRVYGPPKVSGANAYFINPVGIQYMIMSAKELGKDTALTIDSLTAFSARVHLRKDSKSLPAVSFPLVQGMAFVTGQYAGGTPVIQTGVFFRSITKVKTNPKTDVAKFNVVLEDGSTWHIYSHRTGGTQQLDLKLVNNGNIEAQGPFTGVVQICKGKGNEAVYDEAAGIYATSLDLGGSVSGTQGTYSFKFKRAGHSQGRLLMFALPHHVNSFDAATRKNMTPLRLQTTVKGVAAAVFGDQWTMVEPTLPTSMGFAPWTLEKGSIAQLSENAKSVIRPIASREISQNMRQQTDLDSMYFSGKALAKFAQILYVIHTLLGDRALAQTGLAQLKTEFARFADGTNKFPLVYDAAWRGIVSSATYTTKDNLADFGNTLYNDHHFHYGYHILTAAMIGQMDPSWLSKNRDYVDALVRDVANPSTKDNFFPAWRAFDWYHGHSWAHGLFPSMDGKNQESSSEDVMHAYAIKMWGRVTGNTKMEARANIQLAILGRSLKLYYLYTRDNTVQPSQFINNKAAGILFENKVDHATFFDPAIEAIQGIHMIPILPASQISRSAAFVKEEWETYFSNGRIDGVNSLWKGVVYANYAIVEPRRAWDFFRQNNINPAWIDGGASLTWYLTHAAALGNI